MKQLTKALVLTVVLVVLATVFAVAPPRANAAKTRPPQVVVITKSIAIDAQAYARAQAYATGQRYFADVALGFPSALAAMVQSIGPRYWSPAGVETSLGGIEVAMTKSWAYYDVMLVAGGSVDYACARLSRLGFTYHVTHGSCKHTER
jgi:hypothetical protein